MLIFILQQADYPIPCREAEALAKRRPQRRLDLGPVQKQTAKPDDKLKGIKVPQNTVPDLI